MSSLFQLRRIPQRTFSTAASSVAPASRVMKQAMELSGAPASAASIPSGGGWLPADTRVCIREVGCTRHVFLLHPYLSLPQIEGLAYRIRALTKNDAINSILIANSLASGNDDAALEDEDPVLATMPFTVIDRNSMYFNNGGYDAGFPPKFGYTFHVSSGYSALDLYQSGDADNPQAVNVLLSSLSDLALANLGDARITRVPTICAPHGAVRDAGFAFLWSSYVLATQESSFRIVNPLRGLSLDPVGLSYVLPRLGQEFKQPSKNYPCGMIVGLMGYEANASDMMETGLATNYIESAADLGVLESALAEIRPWNQQGLLKKPRTYCGEEDDGIDHNAEFRNVTVADTINCFSDYRADGNEMWDLDESDAKLNEDPSLDFDSSPWHAYRTSDLVDYAATFADIFATESSVVGILERFREIAARTTNDPEEQEGIDVAADFCARMERQSPLALCAVHRLLCIGAKTNETIERCMKRERTVQRKLFAASDFRAWAEHALKHGGDGDSSSALSFTGWKHRSIKDVSDDEVSELLED